MSIEERLKKVAYKDLVRQAEQVTRAQSGKVTLTARLGRTLVSVGQRLETGGIA